MSYPNLTYSIWHFSMRGVFSKYVHTVYEICRISIWVKYNLPNSKNKVLWEPALRKQIVLTNRWSFRWLFQRSLLNYFVKLQDVQLCLFLANTCECTAVLQPTWKAQMLYLPTSKRTIRYTNTDYTDPHTPPHTHRVSFGLKSSLSLTLAVFVNTITPT